LFKSVCSASKNSVVTADPLTLSLRFAAMGVTLAKRKTKRNSVSQNKR